MILEGISWLKTFKIEHFNENKWEHEKCDEREQ